MHRTSLWIAAICALSTIANAQIVTIAYESFDYNPTPIALGSQNGGTGWENAWYSGGAGTDAMVVTPGVDIVGGKAVTNGLGGSYRKPDRAPWPNLLEPSGKFGRDGTTFWFTFFLNRIPGGDDQYGGFSLFEQFNGEKLFIGCPFIMTTWGVLSYGAANLFSSVPGTSCDNTDRIVVRIDFLPGMERLRMWVNPPALHPISSAPVDAMIYDFIWDEIRIESGSGTIGGYEFDALLIEAQLGPLFGDVNSISAASGGSQNLMLEAGVSSGSFLYYVVGTVSGTSPGVAAPPFVIPINPDAYTTLTLTSPNTPPLLNNVNVLDANGNAVITLTLPSVAPSVIGLIAHHAGIVFDSNGGIGTVTNAFPVSIAP